MGGRLIAGFLCACMLVVATPWWVCRLVAARLCPLGMLLVATPSAMCTAYLWLLPCDWWVCSWLLVCSQCVWRKNFESSICHAKCWWKFIVIITISDRSFFERVLNRRFPEKINAKSLFSILVIVIQCGSMWKKRWKNHSFLPPLVRKITNLHRNRKNRKTKNIAPF